jgi:glucose-6-phosphate 1-dehydrogenase
MLEKIDNPFIFTVFGASGDLAKLKIFPSFFALAAQNRLPKNFMVVGYARSKKTQEQFRQEFADSIRHCCERQLIQIQYSEQIVENLLKHVFYFSGQYDQLEDFENFFTFLHDAAKELNQPLPKTHIAYFSVPPSVFQPILQNLALARHSADDDLRVVLEKPFGEDEESAESLFHFISRFYEEDQVFLLDHYLGKISVQSILALRHNNAILNILLRGRNIANIQITAHEMVGVEDRAGYFDSVGLIKDMFQSHITQLLAMATMYIPISPDAKSFHREKQSVLSALDFTPKAEHVFLGQYKGYENIDGIEPNSKTETYFAAKLKIDRESWYGVPIFVRTGKQMDRKLTSIVVEFKKLPFQKDIEPNRLVFELQPDEMIHIRLLNKFGQSSEYHEIGTRESIAYRGVDFLPEHSLLLLDVLANNRLHFLSFPEILASWSVTDKILEFIKQNNLPVHGYEQGIAAPPQIEDIFQVKEERWFEV